MLKWEEVDKDFVCIYEDFIFRLQMTQVGIYGSGSCYSLQCRKKNESKFNYLGYSFWTKDDGSSYNNLQHKSVDNKLWEDNSSIILRTNQILERLGFL